MGGAAISTTAQADILVVTNVNNSVDQLTLREVKKLFLGRMSRFPHSGEDVSVLDLDEQQKLHQKFYEYVIEMDSSRLKRYRARYLFSGKGMLPEKVTNQQEMLKQITEKLSAVGYIELEGEQPLPEGVKVVFRFDTH